MISYRLAGLSEFTNRIALYVTVNKAMATGLPQACFSPGRAIFVLVYSNSAQPSPADEDLLWTVTHGLRWTGMIARPDLSKAELNAVVQQLKSFSPRFTRDKPAASVNVARQPPRTPVLVEQGKKMFRDADCVSCHGEQGRGDGPSAADMTDDWGSPIRPGDLTWRPLKRGSSLQAIYLTIVTGLSGTPMPAYGDSLSPDEVWAIVYYLESLVPIEHRLSPARLLGEERQGRMALHMGGMMGPGH